MHKLPVWVWPWVWFTWVFFPQFFKGTSSSLSYLEKRHEWVLSQSGRLQEKVRVLAENLGVWPAEVGILQQQQV